jgi:N-acetylneuraminic acid mutarotase
MGDGYGVAGREGRSRATKNAGNMFLKRGRMKSEAKLGLLLLSLFVVLSACQTTTDNTPTPTTTHKWAWMSGSNTVNQTGTYGTRGTAAAANIPGAREQAAAWSDASGKFWLFGGYAFDAAGYRGHINDLWKYDPTTGQWTWISGGNLVNQAGVYGTLGVPSPSNVPGARMGAVSWVDPQGLFWLFGGIGYAEGGAYGNLNDLWRFDPATLEWTWVSGDPTVNMPGTYGTKGAADPANGPGARTGAVSWLDTTGLLWLFGGSGYDSAGDKGWLNDLWKYDPADSQWTWVSGGQTEGQPGVYGTKETPDPANIPGGRYAAAAWSAQNGFLWLLGGDGLDSAGDRGDLNDLWKYDPATNQWAWFTGNDIRNSSGVYGTQDIASASNYPGGRFGAARWLDSDGRLWLAGGCGRDSTALRGWLNDVWIFDPATEQWNWVSGSNIGSPYGVYGTLGTAATTNVSGARYHAVSWIDSQDKIWLFGGYGTDSVAKGGWLNDLWNFVLE